MTELIKKSFLVRAFKIIRLSLNGEQQDYTQGSISKAVFLLAIPMILELSLESVFAIVDMFFVSKLGQNAIATVGLTESVITIVYSIAIGLSTAATAIVARRIGEKNPEAAAHAGAQAIIIALLITVILSIVGAIFASDILRLMGASNEVVEEGTVFTRIMFAGSDKRNIPWSRRCCNGNEKLMAGKCYQYYSLPDSYTLFRSEGCSNCNCNRTIFRSGLSVLSFIQRKWNSEIL